MKPKTWMLRNYEQCIDRETGLLCCTSLAEQACDALDLYENDECDIPEALFELAVAVNDELAEQGLVQADAFGSPEWFDAAYCADGGSCYSDADSGL